jgi:hypothetical protein
MVYLDNLIIFISSVCFAQVLPGIRPRQFGIIVRTFAQEQGTDYAAHETTSSETLFKDKQAYTG